MKVLDLQCDGLHVFEGWFGSENDFQGQLGRGLVTCPICGSHQVQKMLSAPRLNLKTPQSVDETPNPHPSTAAVAERSTVALAQGRFLNMMRAMLASSQDVGEHFAQEARKIHHGETEERAIHGMATLEETYQLLNEGIEVLPIPNLTKETLQ